MLRAPSAFAAACCAGNSAAPSILSSDDAAQLSISAARGTVIGDAPAQGIPVFRNDGSSEVTTTYLLSGAMLLSDRWQAGAAIPLVNHTLQTPAGNTTGSTSLGDLRFTTAYEFLPEWTYSNWKPRGFVFAQLTLPTGVSIYESQIQGAVDAAGKGFTSASLGTLLVKRWAAWDAYALPELHYSFSRAFTPDFQAAEIQAGSNWGGSFALGVGLSPGAGDFRVGLRVQPIYESPRDVTSAAGLSVTSEQLSWNSTLEATYMAGVRWSINAAYTDQTLLGPAINTSLSRIFALALQHRWQR